MGLRKCEIRLALLPWVVPALGVMLAFPHHASPQEQRTRVGLGEIEQEHEPENFSDNMLREIGGQIGEKVIEANPELFPTGLSPREKLRRLIFFLPRADASGRIDSDQNFRAWEESQARAAKQRGKVFSLDEPIEGVNSPQNF